MRSKFKIGFICLIIIAVIFLFPSIVNANGIYGYQKISADSSFNKSINNVLFKDIKLVNRGNNKFNLEGFITNHNNNEVHVTISTEFYDEDSNIIGSAGYEKQITTDLEENVVFVADAMDFLSEYSFSDIKYLGLNVTVYINDKSVTNSSDLENNQYSDYDYVIDNYNITMKVNENNTFDITEKIDTTFNTYKHGIIRTLPVFNDIRRLDGSTSSNRAQITNIKVNENFSKEWNTKNLSIKIGDANKEIIGKKKYTISYNYNIGKDPLKDKDELYYNLIGTDWNTIIRKVNFTIVMPKEFDDKRLGFSVGSEGSIGNNGLKYSVEGNIITGRYDNTLLENQSITVRLELDDGYFVGAGYKLNYADATICLIIILLLVISFLVWYFFGKDKKIVETVEFYPPEGFNSLEVAYIYKGDVGPKDVMSLLIYLADKGYIRIEEIENKSLFSSSESFKVIKLKEYDGVNESEELFLLGLFEDSTEMNEGFKEVKSSRLKSKFYVTVNSILFNFKKKENREKLFTVKGRNLIVIAMILTYILIGFRICYESKNIDIYFVLLFPLIALFVMFFAFLKLKNNDRSQFILMLVWSFFFGGLPTIGFLIPFFYEFAVSFWILILGFISIIIMCILYNLMKKRTDMSLQLYGRIKVFKNFLEIAEKEKLEALVKENPTYFYDILPYTYVLGVSDKWIKKFESIVVAPPNWYGTGEKTFNFLVFGKLFNETMNFASGAILSSVSGSSSGFSGGSSSGASSGGGTSGGGSGGGGGSSW